MEQNYPKEQSVYTAASFFPSVLLKPILVLSKPSKGLLTHFGGLNENGPRRLIDLNMWSPVGGTAWEG